MWLFLLVILQKWWEQFQNHDIWIPNIRTCRLWMLDCTVLDLTIHVIGSSVDHQIIKRALLWAPSNFAGAPATLVKGLKCHSQFCYKRLKWLILTSYYSLARSPCWCTSSYSNFGYHYWRNNKNIDICIEHNKLIPINCAVEN